MHNPRTKKLHAGTHLLRCQSTFSYNTRTFCKKSKLNAANPNFAMKFCRLSMFPVGIKKYPLVSVGSETLPSRWRSIKGEKMKLILSSLVLFVASIQANAELLSTTTKLADEACVVYDGSVLQKQPEIDFLTEECPGLGGYQVMISGGDLRYPMSLIYGGKEIKLTNLGSFHQAYGEVTWLFTRVGGQVIYKSLIHRVDYNEPDKVDALHMLVITKLDKENTCAVATVQEAPDMEEQARALAEKAESLSCLDLR